MKIRCLEVNQPLAPFYVASISSSFLKKVTHSRATQIEGMDVTGNQRSLDDSRVREIGRYLATNNAAIPNSIILAVNYYEDDSLEMEPQRAWSINEDEKGLYINVPDESLKLAAIVDGQHRINGFYETNVEMDIPCSVYFELLPSLQAFLFATINFNQKKVDKSLAYQLFGYQLDDSAREFWSPDIVAVKLSREFNIAKGGPFESKIVLIKKTKSSKDDEKSGLTKEESDADEALLSKDLDDHSWSISSACFISGVVSLLTGNAKDDRYTLGKKSVFGHRTRSDLKVNDNYPLRQFYLEMNDLAIKMVIERYFTAIQNTLWKNKASDSIVFRTIGISAQFDFLKELLVSKKVPLGKDMEFESILNNFSDITFDNEFFSPRTATKKRIMDVFRLKAGLITEDSVSAEIVNAANI